MLRRYAPALAAGLVLCASLTGCANTPTPPDSAVLSAATPGQNSFRQFTTTADWTTGYHDASVAVRAGSLRLTGTPARTTLAGTSYDVGRWTSDWITPSHSFTELIPSWRAATPAGTLVRVSVRAKSTTGTWSSWQEMARWTSADTGFARTSLGAQTDSVSSVATDTLVARTGVAFRSYRLRVALLRRSGSASTPVVGAVHGVASQLASTLSPTSARLLPAKVLPVPTYSQMTHRGQYPAYGGGGEAWCSPTSLSMVLGYYGALPPATSYAWVSSSYADRWVDAVARSVFDNGYDGTGNWPFNTSYAATRGLESKVTRLSSLRDAERFIAAGIPLEASISFSSGQLSGAPISATAGHLVVIVGFNSAGNVVVNDPAASSNSTVRRTYDRGQFERAWQRKSHGLVYAIRDGSRVFPAGYGL